MSPGVKIGKEALPKTFWWTLGTGSKSLRHRTKTFKRFFELVADSDMVGKNPQ